jgi:predicted nucleic acid-binding protein
VRLELWRGIHDKDEEAEMERLESVVTDLTIDAEAWAACLRLSHAARRRGHRPPATDIVIAATAKRHAAALDYEDRHMAFLDSLDL